MSGTFRWGSTTMRCEGWGRRGGNRGDGRFAARAGDQLLALGLHDPESVFAAELGSEHAPAAVSPVGDVTIYPIQLEPVDRVLPLGATSPQLVKPREVMIIPLIPAGRVPASDKP